MSRAPESAALDREIRRAERRVPQGSPEENGTGPGASPAEALTAARVDLVERIRQGVPEREFVPGGDPWLLVGKRYLLYAPAGLGKSLLALVIAVDVVAAGGTVAILDVENGADEYARRLSDVLDARDGEQLADACSERLRYFEWPAVRVTWGAEEWVEAHDGADLAIFDSSRLVLSQAGLAEDSNDDYAQFVNGLLIPLARAGVTTIVLDNTGHEERDRARGASAKADLNEVAYAVKSGEEFDRDRAGHLRLVRRRTRFADLPGELQIPLGGGTYGPAVEAAPAGDSDAFRPTGLMERASKAIEDNPGLNRTELLTLVGGKRKYAAAALGLLVGEGNVRTEQDGREKRHYSETPYREADDGS